MGDRHSGSLRERRRHADLTAVYARHLGRNGFEAGRQEELLQDARAWAEAELRAVVSSVADANELKTRVVKQTWDRFIQTHRYYSNFQLGYLGFESALWEEGWPSLEDLAIEAFSLFPNDDPKAGVWPKFFAQQRRWFELHVSFGKELALVTGPSNYWDWLLKHAEIIPKAIDRDPITCRPITVASRPPVTYNPDWIADEPDRSTDIEYIKRLHSRMLDESVAAFSTQEGDRDVEARLVEFWAQHLSGVIGSARSSAGRPRFRVAHPVVEERD